MVVVRLATFYELNVGSFPLLFHPLFTSLLASMIARPDCVSISCGTSATRPCYRWPSRFTSDQPQPVVTLIDNASSLPDTPILQILVRHLIDGLCHRPVHLVTHHRHGTLVQLLLLGTDTLVDIFPALFDEGKRLHTSTCPHHTYSANASTRILDSRARAVANTDAPYITA
jgi:hypothetical protein